MLCVRTRNGRGLGRDLDIWLHCSFYKLLNYYHFTEITSERDRCVFKSYDSNWITFARVISNFSKWWVWKYLVPRIYITLSSFLYYCHTLNRKHKEKVCCTWEMFHFMGIREKKKNRVFFSGERTVEGEVGWRSCYTLTWTKVNSFAVPLYVICTSVSPWANVTSGSDLGTGKNRPQYFIQYNKNKWPQTQEPESIS